MGLEQRFFAWRVGAFFGALCLVYGVSVPYLPVYLDASGLTALEIGVISSAPLFLRLFLTPGFAIYADQNACHRGMIIALTCTAAGAIALLAGARGFWPLLICVAAFQVAVQSVMPLVEAIALAGVKRAGHDYGRMRLCGSVTFIVATIVGAWVVEGQGAASVVALLAAATVATLVASFALPTPQATESRTPVRKLEFKSAYELAASRPILMFLLAAGAAQSAHAVFYAFGVLHWRSNGVPAAWIGTLWSIGVIAEIILFWYSAAVLRHVRAVDLIAIGAAASVVRWTAMAFDPPLALLIPLQILHGLTYGASHLGAMHFIKDRVPEGQAGTAQALYSTVTAGVGMGLALLLAGFAYQRLGGLSYLTMAVLALPALAAALVLRREQLATVGTN